MRTRLKVGAVAAAVAAATLTPLAPSTADAATTRTCDYRPGTNRTVCVTKRVVQRWVHVDYAYGTSNDGSPTALWCQQEQPGTPITHYETFQTDFLVETTVRKRVVRRGHAGKRLRVVRHATHVVLDYEMPRDPAQEAAAGDALTCA